MKLRTEIFATLAVAALCLAVGTGLSLHDKQAGWWRWTCLSVIICLVASLPPIFLRRWRLAGPSAALFPLLTVGWRSLVVLFPLVASAATKWPEHNSFSLCLLGCYFPFLLLESGLSIVYARLPSGPQAHVQHHPPHQR